MHIKRKCIVSFTLHFWLANFEWILNAMVEQALGWQLEVLSSIEALCFRFHWTFLSLFTHIPCMKAVQCCTDIIWTMAVLYSEVCVFHMPTMRQLYLNIKLQETCAWESQRSFGTVSQRHQLHLLQGDPELLQCCSIFYPFNKWHGLRLMEIVVVSSFRHPQRYHWIFTCKLFG